MGAQPYKHIYIHIYIYIYIHIFCTHAYVHIIYVSVYMSTYNILLQAHSCLQGPRLEGVTGRSSGSTSPRAWARAPSETSCSRGKRPRKHMAEIITYLILKYV